MGATYKATLLYAAGRRDTTASTLEHCEARIIGGARRSLLLSAGDDGSTTLTLHDPMLDRFDNDALEFVGFVEVDGQRFFQRVHLEVEGGT